MPDKYFLPKFKPTVIHSALLMFVLLIGITQISHADEPLPLTERTLVVYNANLPESVEVANYYLTQRGIPAANTCAITPPDPTAIEWNDFDSNIRTPIKSCLESLGKDRILYIVFTYQTPFRLLNIPTESGLEMRAVDAFIADIWNDQPQDVTQIFNHPYYAASQSQGNFYPAFVSLADYRKQPEAKTIYAVWRLDAPTVDLAKGLIDKAIQTEARGLQGQGCFDRRFGNIAGIQDWGYGAGDWDLKRAADLSRLGGLPVTEDEEAAEFGTAPALLQCDQVALYAGWYEYNHYNDAFTWANGAIGFHLDSASAIDPRGGANWSANALARGITITSGAVNEPYLEGLPRADGVFRNLFAGANVGDAMLRNTAFLQWMVINMGDPLYRPFPNGVAPFNDPNYAQNSLALDSPFLVGGKATTGIVTLATPAPEGGLEIQLTNSSPWAATIPGNVFINAGETKASFAITTESTAYYQAAIITANVNGETISNTLGLGPLLAGIIFTPPNASGGTTVTGTIYLNDFAPSGGAVVTLVSDYPEILSVPETIFIPEGQNKAKFTTTLNTVTENTYVTISATHEGSTQLAIFAVLSDQ